MRRYSNCYMRARPGETLLSRSGMAHELDGYAVVPIEDWLLRRGARMCSDEPHFPCQVCGVETPTPEGHDPCIANLPGVRNACCGHGVEEGYVQFEDGRIIRGAFEVSDDLLMGECPRRRLR